MEFGRQFPSIQVEPPGPVARAWVDRLAEVECPAITARRDRRRAGGGSDPIVWARARGANVEDVDGNVYVDLSAGFAVASVGHAHPRVVEAARGQLDTLIHGMGDLFPNREKIELAEQLASLTGGALPRSIFGMSGSDAVEACIKTALITTGRRRVLGFSGGYHGMSLGALGVSGYRDSFREPFGGQVAGAELRLPYPGTPGSPYEHDDGTRSLEHIAWLLRSDVVGGESIAAVIVEPVQGRAGDIVPPPGWLAGLRTLTREAGVLLIFDEIYTGFGRTGRWFAHEHEGVVPDLMAVGKSLGGGFPLSACLGSEAAMAGWALSSGEAIHTSTFLGNPLGCRMGLAVLSVLREEGLVERAAALGARALGWLREGLAGDPRVAAVRGVGMMMGVALERDGAAWAGGGVAAMTGLLERGFIVSPGGAQGEVISLAPPLVIDEAQLEAGVAAVIDWVRQQPA